MAQAKNKGKKETSPLQRPIYSMTWAHISNMISRHHFTNEVWTHSLFSALCIKSHQYKSCPNYVHVLYIFRLYKKRVGKGSMEYLPISKTSTHQTLRDKTTQQQRCSTPKSRLHHIYTFLSFRQQVRPTGVVNSHRVSRMHAWLHPITLCNVIILEWRSVCV